MRVCDSVNDHCFSIFFATSSTHTHFRTHTHFHTHSFSLTHTLTLTLSLTLSLTHTHTLVLTLSLTHTLVFTLSLSPSLFTLCLTDKVTQVEPLNLGTDLRNNSVNPSAKDSYFLTVVGNYHPL